MEAARDRNLCRAIIINKMDMPEVHLEDLVQQIRDAFGNECLPMTCPRAAARAWSSVC